MGMMAELLDRWRLVFHFDADKRELLHKVAEAEAMAQRGRQTFQEALDQIPHRLRRSPRPPTNGLDGRLDIEDKLVREALG
jgi:hypothetical protein